MSRAVILPGSIGHKMIWSDVGRDFYTPTLSLECSDLLPAALPLLTAPFFQRRLQTDGHEHGHERSLCAAAVTENGSKHLQTYRWIKLSTGASPQRRFLQISWYSEAFICHFFHPEEVAICLLCSTLAFERDKHRICASCEAVNSRRWRWDFCFLAFYHVLALLSRLDSIFPRERLALAQFYSTDDISTIVFSFRKRN